MCALQVAGELQAIKQRKLARLRLIIELELFAGASSARVQVPAAAAAGARLWGSAASPAQRAGDAGRPVVPWSGPQQTATCAPNNIHVAIVAAICTDRASLLLISSSDFLSIWACSLSLQKSLQTSSR
jgi:hypothetical protein